MADSLMTAMCIPCGKETWRKIAKRMFQHRSLSLLLRRTSTATVQSRFVAWQDCLSWGQSIGTSSLKTLGLVRGPVLTQKISSLRVPVGHGISHQTG